MDIKSIENFYYFFFEKEIVHKSSILDSSLIDTIPGENFDALATFNFFCSDKKL